MSKKQSDSTLEAFVSLATLAAQHPEATKAAFNVIDALGAVTYDLTTAALDYLLPRKPIASEPEPQRCLHTWTSSKGLSRLSRCGRWRKIVPSDSRSDSFPFTTIGRESPAIKSYLDFVQNNRHMLRQ